MMTRNRLFLLSALTLSATPAFAQGSPGGSGGNALVSFLPIILMFAAMYFLIIAPQRKKQKQHDAMVKALKQGDKVVSVGGIHGVVASVKDDLVVVKVAENTKLEFTKNSISQVVTGASGSVQN